MSSTPPMSTPSATDPSAAEPAATAPDDADLTIGHRFRGPARSGNGGYTAGSLAEHVPVQSEAPVIEVTLRQPPPLDTAMVVRQRAADDRAADAADAAAPGSRGRAPTVLTVLTVGDSTVAEARVLDTDRQGPAPVETVDADVATEAMHHYAGLRNHPFPECFACGPDRAEGDGLQIFPGPVPGRADTVASLWVPHRSLAESGDVSDPGLERVGAGTTWAALDCVGGWSEDLEGRPMVLGRITARLDALPVVGEPHVVVGRRLRQDRRKTFTASTLYDSDGRVVAAAEHVWIAVDPTAFN